MDDTGQQAAEAYRSSGAKGGDLPLDLFVFLPSSLSSSVTFSAALYRVCSCYTQISKQQQPNDALPHNYTCEYAHKFRHTHTHSLLGAKNKPALVVRTHILHLDTSLCI